MSATAAYLPPTSDPTRPKRGHHVEVYLQSFAGRPSERETEAKRWKAAGVDGSIKVYYLNLLLVSLAVVQIKGALSWKMRETVISSEDSAKIDAELKKLEAEGNQLQAEANEIFAKADAELDAFSRPAGIESRMRTRRTTKDTKDD